MGATSSKPYYSSFDDLVGDHSDVWLKLKEFLGFKSSCTLPVTNSLELPEILLKSPCSQQSDSLSVVVHCEVTEGPLEGEETAAAEAAEAAAAEAAAAEASAAVPADFDAPTAGSSSSSSSTAAATATAAAAPSPPPWVPRLQLPVTTVAVPDLPELTRRSVRDAVAAARAEVEALFTCIDQEQQHQEKEEAINELAAAAAARGNSSEHTLSSEEKAALRAKGREAQLAAKCELLTRAAASDAALREMSVQKREQWFQEHAQQLQTDVQEASFEDEWASLPPEVMAMVAELQSK